MCKLRAGMLPKNYLIFRALNLHMWVLSLVMVIYSSQQIMRLLDVLTLTCTYLWVFPCLARTVPPAMGTNLRCL